MDIPSDRDRYVGIDMDIASDRDRYVGIDVYSER